MVWLEWGGLEEGGPQKRTSSDPASVFTPHPPHCRGLKQMPHLIQELIACPLNPNPNPKLSLDWKTVPNSPHQSIPTWNKLCLFSPVEEGSN